MRIDTPHTSVISDPAGQRTIMLDHLKKEAMVIPMPPLSPSPSQSGGPQVPGGAPKLAPPLQVHDLGKSLIEGHEVEGKRYTFSPPQAPRHPSRPKCRRCRRLRSRPSHRSLQSRHRYPSRHSPR